MGVVDAKVCVDGLDVLLTGGTFLESLHDRKSAPIVAAGRAEGVDVTGFELDATPENALDHVLPPAVDAGEVDSSALVEVRDDAELDLISEAMDRGGLGGVGVLHGDG